MPRGKADRQTGIIRLDVLADIDSQLEEEFELRMPTEYVPAQGHRNQMKQIIREEIKFEIYVLTQFQSQSLNRYLTHTYNLTEGVPVGGDAFVEILNSTMSPEHDRWNQGTADAVRQFTWILEDVRRKLTIQDVIVLPSDQLYQTDFSGPIHEHRQSDADMTILCHPVDVQQAEQLGILQVKCSDATGFCHVGAFQEKPKGIALEAMRTSPAAMKAFQRPHPQPQGRPERMPESEAALKPFLASTGIYIFKREVLVDMLKKYVDANNFGSDIIPRAVQDGYKVLAVEMAGPWRDVGGSLKDFYEASMELICARHPTFLDAPRHLRKPLFKAPEALPPVLYGAPPSRVTTSYIAPGAVIGGSCKIDHSIIGVRSIIGDGCQISDALILGADGYDSRIAEGLHAKDDDGEVLPFGIGPGCVIQKAIVDKNAHIGANVKLINSENVYNSTDYSALGVWIRDGIIVVTKNATIPEGTVI